MLPFGNFFLEIANFERKAFEIVRDSFHLKIPGLFPLATNAFVISLEILKKHLRIIDYLVELTSKLPKSSCFGENMWRRETTVSDFMKCRLRAGLARIRDRKKHKRVINPNDLESISAAFENLLSRPLYEKCLTLVAQRLSRGF